MTVKFGGTSVASAERWGSIARIVERHRAVGHRVLVVCSALATVTNRLEALAAARGAAPGLHIEPLRALHLALGRALGTDAARVLEDELAGLEVRAAAAGDARGRAELMAQGELMSSKLGAAHLRERLGDVAWLDAREVLSALDGSDDANAYLSARCSPAFDQRARDHLDALEATVVVTQGFIARRSDGRTALLGRGGSDASAAYLAAAIGASAVEIWSDVPGLFTADPRAISGARLLRRLSYEEAESLGALGAKVLHPRSIEPARAAGLPIRLGWTAHTDVAGTRILGSRQPRGAKAIVSRRDLALFTLWRAPSWQPVGFMADVAARFAAHGVSMDLIASSPSQIRATVDLAAFPGSDIDALAAELMTVASTRLMRQVACVSIAGEGVARDLARSGRGAAVFAECPIHLVSHAASGAHVSVVIDERDASGLVSALHERLVAPREDDATFGPAWSTLTRGHA